MNSVSVPVTVVVSEDNPIDPVADEIPEIEGTVNVKVPTDVVPIEIKFPASASEADNANWK